MRILAALAVLLFAGCASVLPHTFPPSYATNPGQQCVKACWIGGHIGCTSNPLDHCWWNGLCKERCDVVERDALKAKT